MLEEILREEILMLFAIMALGSLVGHVRIKGISLGTAGVLFVALLFGHFGVTISHEIREIGLLLFVYAVGLQAGPRFFRTFRKTGIRYLTIGLTALITGLIVTIILGNGMGLPYELSSGLFCGALTNTPALAAATDVITRLQSPNVGFAAAGYGIAYPFSMIGVVVLIQLMPRFMGRRLERENAELREEFSSAGNSLMARQFRVVNPACDGQPLREVNPGRIIEANISRIYRDGHVLPVTAETTLTMGDVVLAVGPAEELRKMRVLLGEEMPAPVQMDVNTNVVFLEVNVTQDKVVGKTLAELGLWERFGVVITRIRRQMVEFSPKGRTALEFGDVVRLVGEQDHVDAAAEVLGDKEHNADETSMIPFLIGLMIGVGIGLIPLHFAGMEVTLGMSGGAFVVSLILGHFGRIGPFRMQVPAAAKIISRELGLMLFLAGAGTNAGSKFMGVFNQYGWSILGAGALVTSITVLVTLILTLYIFRMKIYEAMGALAACMTNPPALGAASKQTDLDVPALAYASVYPVALIFKVIFVQMLAQFMFRLSGGG